MKKQFFVALLLIASAAILTGCHKEDDPQPIEDKGSIIGVITDFATGEPVRSANVQLRPTGETTLTGTDGIYEFNNLPNSKYAITVSKAEYSELVDEYVIEIINGKTMRRDVQIKKLPTYIAFTDMQNNEISVLDFGADNSLTTKMFNVFNHGTVPIRCQKVYSCNWISSVSDLPSEIQPGQIVQVSISINRSLLSLGKNSTIFAISTNNGSNEITIKATSANGNPPIVSISPVSNITATSTTCQGQIQNDNGSNVIDCGFCYSTHTSPTLNDNCIRLGPNTGTFSYRIASLLNNTTYYIRAFATSILGTGYSSEITFTTMSGLPTCSATTIICIDPTTAKGISSAIKNSEYVILDKGLCWNTNHTPTINDQAISCGFGDGPISGYLSQLQPNTTYRVRSYATSEFGTTYGPEEIFTSLSGIPSLTTKPAVLSGNEIITGGNITDDAGTTLIEKGVCYGISPNPDISSAYQHTVDDCCNAEEFSSYIPKPSYSGYIYIRAYANTRYGSGYGNQVQIYIP